MSSFSYNAEIFEFLYGLFDHVKLISFCFMLKHVMSFAIVIGRNGGGGHIIVHLAFS